MHSSDTTQALVAAFAFGIVAQAAVGLIYTFTKDHGLHSFRDGPRLVLIVFLAGAALWSMSDFVSVSIDGDSAPGCQIATSFTLTFDQIARVSFMQFVLWGVQNGLKTTAQTYVLQTIVLLRFLMGGVIVGLTRTQSSSEFCVSTSLVWPLNLASVVFDCGMAFFLLVKVFIQGSFKVAPEGSHSIVLRKVLVFNILAFALWSAMSAPMLLGYSSLSLLVRTFLPALGLIILLTVVALSRAHLSFSPQRAASVEQGGPFSSGAKQHSREPGSQDSGYNSDPYAPPNRYEEVKGESAISVNAFGQQPRSNRVVNHGKTPSLGQIGRPHLQQGPAGVGFDHESTFAPSRQAPAPHAPRALPSRSLPKKGGKIQISAPVLVAHSDADKDPLQRIATIDLATAARNEQERRAMPAQPLSSNFLAPDQASRALLSPQAMMKQTGSVKRKEIGASPDQHTTTEPLPDSSNIVTVTSSQLSPGVEELRRRSPRQPPQGPLSSNSTSSPRSVPNVPAKSVRRSQHALSVLTASDPKTRPSSTLPLTPPPKSPKRGQAPLSPFGQVDGAQTPPLPSQPGLVKVVIKPAVRAADQATSPPVPPKDSPVVNVRPLNGLPKNPRMAGPRSIVQQKTPKEQTVMLLKNIEYDDPAAVRDIVSGAANKASHKRIPSVVHRPRPIPRQSGLDRQVFPAEGSPSPNSKHGHKRSLSNGSAVKSILRSVPSSPSKLPPLPPVPQTAGQPERPQPNNTRSMTFDEKMAIFYPGSSAASQPKEMRRRSSSVPELPQLPAAFRERQRSRSRDGLRDSAHHTDKSNRSSVRTASLLDFPEVPAQRTTAPTSKFSVDTAAGEGLVWAAATKAKIDGRKRQSSPVLPLESYKSLSYGSELKTNDDDATTVWGSIHSPAECTVMQKAMAIEVPPVPKIGRCPLKDAQVNDKVEDKRASEAQDNESQVMMTVVLDTSDRGSPLQKQGPSADVGRVMEADPRPASWHRRIGDQCPMFSGRHDSVKRRKNPPPAPLPLIRTHDRRPRLVAAPEASPLEKPEDALEAIQEQLRKFEDPNRESTGSQQLQRMTLLANLEAEMGVHENQWQQMQSRLDRDSFSTTTGSPRKRESRPESLAVSIVAQADDRAHKPARRSSRAGSVLAQLKRTASVASNCSLNSCENEHEWDEDLAEAQAEYLKHRFQLVSQLSERTTSMLVASPTHIEQPSHAPARGEQSLAAVPSGSPARLWQPSQVVTATVIDTTPALWTGGLTSVNASFHVEEQPDILRRTLGRALEPLFIESNHLWQKKIKRGSFGPQKGLWASKIVSRPISTASTSSAKSSTPSTPKLARRPSRRSKRITLLPDILEDPVPMPDKRGTLAIYQFPWGEKSDSASIRPRPQMFMAMPGTMTSGRSTQRQQPEQQQQEPQQPIQLTDPYSFNADDYSAEDYSASFFDDEDDGDNFPEAQALSDEEDRYDDDDEDSDDFDETTLWEIASLLKSNQVPSRHSLLPEDWRYTAEPAEIDYSEPMKINTRGLPERQSDIESYEVPVVFAAAEPAQSALWSSEQATVQLKQPVAVANPDEQTWHEYEANLPAPIRAPTRSDESDSVTSESLWMAQTTSATVPVADALWEARKVEPVAEKLWVPEAQAPQKYKGLADPAPEQWMVYQVTADDVVRAPTRSAQPTTTVSSKSLWAADARRVAVPIAHAMWQPRKIEPVSSGLWVQQHQVQQQPKGLANPAENQWQAYQIAGNDTVRASTRPSEASAIESTHLWKPSLATQKATTSGLWTAQAPKVPIQLWSAPASKQLAPAIGINQPATPAWSAYTSTTLSPVRAKPRLNNISSEIASTALWGAQPSPVREDWISLSTVRARSPSTSSVESAASTASDASSIKSTTTKASTVGSIFSAFWRRKRGVSDAKTEESVPEVPEVPALPRVEEAPTTPIVPETFKEVQPAPATKTSPTVALRRQYRPVIAYRADWDAALQEAINASKPAPSKRQRPTASPADWAAALSAALPQTTQLWTSAPLKSPVPTTNSLWASHLTRGPRAGAFPADTTVLPNPIRRGRAGSVAQDGGNGAAAADAELHVPEGLTEQSLWRRSVAMMEAEVRTRDWLAAGSN